MFRRRCDGQILGVKRLNQPVLHPAHADFPRAELVFEQRANLTRFKDRETVAVRRVADDNVVALVSELVREPLDLFYTVRLVIHRHDERELCAERGQHGEQVNFGEEFNKQVGGRGTAVHDDQICLFQSGEDAVERAAFGQVQEAGVGMKPFQRRVLVVAVNRDMGNALVFEILDEVDGEEAFANAAFAVKDENQSFHCFLG